jgi:Flp pilus assembly protein TadD
LFYLSEERNEEALAEAEASVQLPENQNAGGTHTVLGCALLIHGQTERAIFHLKRGLEIEPEDYRALINLGYAMRDSDLDEAQRLFAAALKYAPDNVEAMANLANCEAIQGNFARAIELMENAIRVAPNDERLIENLNHFREAQRQ